MKSKILNVDSHKEKNQGQQDQLNNIKTHLLR